jgi:hypothetical protein
MLNIPPGPAETTYEATPITTTEAVILESILAVR